VIGLQSFHPWILIARLFGHYKNCQFNPTVFGLRGPRRMFFSLFRLFFREPRCPSFNSRRSPRFVEIRLLPFLSRLLLSGDGFLFHHPFLTLSVIDVLFFLGSISCPFFLLLFFPPWCCNPPCLHCDGGFLSYVSGVNCPFDCRGDPRGNPVQLWVSTSFHFSSKPQTFREELFPIAAYSPSFSFFHLS